MDDVQCSLPGDALKLSFAAHVRPTKWISESVMAVNHFRIATSDFAANGAVRIRVGARPPDFDDPAAFNGHCEAAGVGTIQGADTWPDILIDLSGHR